MGALLIFVMIILYTLQSLLCRKYSETYPGKTSMASPVFTVVSGLIVAIVSVLLCRGGFSAAPLTWILGAINAAVLFLYNTALIYASKSGPYSILMVFMIAGGIALPAVVSAVGFGDPLSVGKILSIAVILVSVYLISRKEEDTAFTKKSVFFIACTLLAITNGVYGALFDIQQRMSGAGEKEEMVAITYACAFLLSALYMLLTQPKEFLPALRQSKKSLVFLLTCSLTVAAAIHLLVYVLQIVNVTVLYTFDNAGVFLVSVLFSHFVFGEKMKVLNWIGCATMCLALVGVSLL